MKRSVPRFASWSIERQANLRIAGGERSPERQGGDAAPRCELPADEVLGIGSRYQVVAANEAHYILKVLPCAPGPTSSPSLAQYATLKLVTEQIEEIAEYGNARQFGKGGMEPLIRRIWQCPFELAFSRACETKTHLHGVRAKILRPVLLRESARL